MVPAFTNCALTFLQAELRGTGTAKWADIDIAGEYRVAQGTCRNLEKKYFRLTGPPDPSTVRPPAVLWAALKRVVQSYRAGQCDMHYTEDQLKAMRQDATVQSLKGKLPVQIYEAHARACLEHGNSGDFNQCQTVLKVLYGEGAKGCLEEFVAYRVLYQSVFRKRESASLLQEMEHLAPEVIVFRLSVSCCGLLFYLCSARSALWATPLLTCGQLAVRLRTSEPCMGRAPQTLLPQTFKLHISTNCPLLHYKHTFCGVCLCSLCALLSFHSNMLQKSTLHALNIQIAHNYKLSSAALQAHMLRSVLVFPMRAFALS